MVVDFHTHIFPDKIAEKTIQILGDKAGIKAYTKGTYDDLLKSMKDGNIDISVVLPVVTNPSQFDSVNKYASKINNKNGIISFGGIHPDNDNYREKIDIIKGLGLQGIKLHPDYQKTFIDDKKYIDIIQYAVDCGLIVSIHAGVDVGIEGEVRCTPKRARNMLDSIKGDNKKIILAHTGGYECWDDVEKYLVGQDMYMDISFSLTFMDKEQFIRIVRNHGIDKILFATDSPWTSQKESVEYLDSLALTREEKDKIYYKNARSLLTKKEK